MMEKKKVNKLLIGTAICGSLFSFSLQAKEIDTNMAQMQAMDKITGKVSVIEVPVNGDIKFGSFSIVVRACKTRPPEETPENFAFVDVVDGYDSEKPANVFRGWMMSSTPGLNAVEHPIYDVWLLKCIDGKVDSSKLLNAEQLKARDEVEKAPSVEEKKAQYIIQEKQTDETSENKEVAPAEKTAPIVAPLVPAIEASKDTLAPEDVVTPPAEATVLDVMEAPILQPNTNVDEEGAPKSLLNMGTYDQTAPAADENAPVMNVNSPALLENEVSVPENVEITEEIVIDKNDETSTPSSLTTPQSLLIGDEAPEANVLNVPLPNVQGVQQAPSPLIGESDDLAKPEDDNQLINFEEVEEEVLDMPSEGIAEQ